MKKYNTKPIDFTDCHPIIAEHSKRGEAIECWVWDGNKKEKIKGWVSGYVSMLSCGVEYVYRTEARRWKHAEPITITTETRVKKASEIVKWLEDNGYEPFTKNGAYGFKKFGRRALNGFPVFHFQFFGYCGKPVDDETPSIIARTPEWLEEVEVTE